MNTAMTTRRSASPTPYNLDVHNSCIDCSIRAERLFCNMAPETVATLDSIKFTAI